MKVSFGKPDEASYELGRVPVLVKYKIHKGRGTRDWRSSAFARTALTTSPVGYYAMLEAMFIAKVRNGFTPELRREWPRALQWA